MRAGTYKMKYIDTAIDKQNETILLFENDIAEDIYDPDFLEFNKSEIISINLV
jgi:hypothetical protein